MRALRSAALLLLVPMLGTAQMPQRDRPPAAPVGDGAITGRVMTSEGRPLARARVVLRLGTGSSGPSAPVNISAGPRSGADFWQQLTDASGRFSFERIPAGTYTLSAVHSRYLSAQYGQRYIGQPARPIELAPGQKLQADLVAVPGGAITGRVFDEFGEPLPDVSVQAYRYVVQGQAKRLMPAGGRSYASNDIGQYRIANLAPGQYVVAAQYRGAIDPSDSGASVRLGYAPTWYPGTLAPSAAQVVRVMPGVDQHGLDFVLQPIQLVQASGTILGANGAPAAGTQLLVTPRDGDVVTSSRPATRVFPNGQFTVSDLAPGEYIFTAQLSATDRTRELVQRGGQGGGGGSAELRSQPREMEYGSIRVTIAGQPVENLSIQLHPGARVGLRVESDLPLPGRRTVMLMAEEQPGISQSASILENGQAVFQSGPGRYRLSLGALPEGWVIERVTDGTRDITASGLVITQTTPVNVVMRVSARGAALMGMAAAGASPAPADYTVVVLAEAPTERTSAAQGVKTVRADQTGRFSVKGLRGGSYFVAALDYVDPNELYDPEFWKRVEPKAILVTLMPGETRQIFAPFISRS